MPLKEFILKCHHNLTKGNSREVAIALEYLTNRNLLTGTIAKHHIGYCSRDMELPETICYLGQENYEKNKKWNMSSCLKGRIIVPIFSEFNKVVGFATRIPSTLPGNTWWNTPFKKSSHIFLLNSTRKDVFNENKIYLVEGYMDALILNQIGLKNVGCIMGTALTTRKIGLIARYCNNVCFCFDSDKNRAGQNAQKIAIAILKKFDFCEKISVIDNLPVGEDPDVFAIKHGLEEFLGEEHILKPMEIKKICKSVETKQKEIIHAQ